MLYYRVLYLQYLEPPQWHNHVLKMITLGGELGMIISSDHLPAGLGSQCSTAYVLVTKVVYCIVL